MNESDFGHQNLCQMQNHLRPIQSVFSGLGGFKMILQSPRIDYVIGESIPFTVRFLNPNQFQILCLSVKLRRIMYSSRVSMKSIVDTVEVLVGRRSHAREFSIGGAFSGKNVNFVSHSDPNLKIRYYIKCEAILKPANGKKTSAICKIEDVLVSRIRKIQNNQLPILELDQPSIDVQNVSDNNRKKSSTLRTPSVLPPAYSQLSSRAVSLMSFDSLPPYYGDLDHGITKLA